MTETNSGVAPALEPEILTPDQVAVPTITNATEIEALAQRYSLEAQTDLQMAQAVLVTDDASYRRAWGLRVAIEKKRKGGEGVVELVCTPLYQKWKRFRELLVGPVTTRQQAIDLLSARRLAYEKQKEAEAEAERKRLEEAARKEQERLNKLALDRAARAEARGEVARAEAILETVPQVPIPAGPVGPAVQRSKGSAKVRYWHAALAGATEAAQRESLKQLVTAVAAGEVPLEAILPNLPWLNKTAKALQRNMKYPGVAVWDDETERSTGR
jgi:hypothetical protein